MKRSLVIVGLLALLLAVPQAAARDWTNLSTAKPSARADFFSPPRELVHYGHVRSLERRGSRYELRFDPAHWLGGVTANRAAFEDGVVRRGESVPNDYYIREDGHRLLTYRVPLDARITVLTFDSEFRSTRVTVAELSQLLKGRNPRGRRLAGKVNKLGFWMRVEVDTVRSLDQQYQP